MNTRRQFLGRLAAPAALGFPSIVKASALGLNGAVAPSNRVTLATIGTGAMGMGHIDMFTRLPAVQYVAVCDIDGEHLAAAKSAVEKRQGTNTCATFQAFEEVLLRRDIDAVSIALPDHWHGLASTLALRFGKDVYGEKPLAHNFHEGLVIVQAQARYNRIWQTGSWQRSVSQFAKACELVRNGRIGKVSQVEVGLPFGPLNYGKFKDKLAFCEPPANFNYDRWLGPAPEMPYWPGRCHFQWRWNLAFGGGHLTDWIGHHLDIAHWGLGIDETGGPTRIAGQGQYPPRDERWNSATRFRITAQYPGNLTVTIASYDEKIRFGTKWIGEKGWIYVDRSTLEASPANLLDSVIGPGEIHLHRGPTGKAIDHYAQFIDSVKTRAETLTPARIALRSVTPGWLGQIAMLTGRPLTWDPDKLTLAGDPEAARMLGRDMRAPYRI
jgi:predicted dehydrogenase